MSRSGDGVVVVGAGAERRERRRPRDALQHRQAERGVGPDPVGDGGQAGPVDDRERGRRGQLAAAAGVRRHFPPPAVMRSTPFSMKFGSLSRRAISQGPMGRTPRPARRCRSCRTAGRR